MRSSVVSTADTAYFHVKITDVAPDGTSKWVNDGGLLATHRSSHAQPEPLEPSRVYELAIELKYMAYVFQKGHRIRVSIDALLEIRDRFVVLLSDQRRGSQRLPRKRFGRAFSLFPLLVRQIALQGRLLIGLQKVERYRLGVVGLEQLVAFGEETLLAFE